LSSKTTSRTVTVHAEQIDPPPSIGERPELLRHHQHALNDHVDPRPQESL